MRDENAVVLDFLEHGRAKYRKNEPIALIIGKEHYNLLEVVPRDDVRLGSGDEVYIGDGEREDIKYIKGKITSKDLTETAKSELDYVLEELVEENEDQFVEFFNEAAPLTPRLHALVLLPSIGEKHMRQIIEERDNGDFKSFDDLYDRVELLPDPRKIIVKRLKEELTGDEKHYLFTTPPKDKDKRR